jgi:hypothetical protein
VKPRRPGQLGPRAVVACVTLLRPRAVAACVTLLRPRAVVGFAALLLPLAAAGCAGGDKAPGGGSPANRPEAGAPGSSEATQIQRLLVRRARALEAGDARGYAATSTGAQRARDLLSGRRASRVRLRDVELAVNALEVSGEQATLRVRSRYGIRGVRGRFVAGRRIVAVRTGAGWRVRSETSRRERHPWEVGPVAERRTQHFVVIAPRGLRVAEGGLLAALEAGYDRMGEVLRRPRLDPRYLVIVAGDARDARRLTEQIRGIGGLAAISDSEVREAGAARQVSELVSQRLLVVWPAFSALDGEGSLRVATHELTHAALAGVTSGRTPAWLLEGVALYVSEDRRVAEAARLSTAPTVRSARRALTLSGLSRPDAIGKLTGAGQEAAYAYSSAAAFYIVARWGRARFLELYDGFNDETLPGRAGTRVTAEAVRTVLGIPLPQLERDLRRWIVTRAVVAPEAP